jgi:hypothetical protein
MPSTVAEAIAEAMDGIGDYLATTAGLTAADGVTVHTGPVEPLPSRDMVMFGDATTPQGRPGLQGRSATPTWNGWVIVARPGSGEDAIRLARARATELMRLIEGAIKADPTMAGTIQPPGGLQVTTSALQQNPADWDGSAVRQATIPFSLSWTSHIA